MLSCKSLFPYQSYKLFTLCPRPTICSQPHTEPSSMCPQKKKIRELQSNVVERDTESNIAKQAKLRKRQRASEVNKTSLAQNLHKNALKTN